MSDDVSTFYSIPIIDIEKKDEYEMTRYVWVYVCTYVCNEKIDRLGLFDFASQVLFTNILRPVVFIVFIYKTGMQNIKKLSIFFMTHLISAIF